MFARAQFLERYVVSGYTKDKVLLGQEGLILPQWVFLLDLEVIFGVQSAYTEFYMAACCMPK